MSCRTDSQFWLQNTTSNLLKLRSTSLLKRFKEDNYKSPITLSLLRESLPVFGQTSAYFDLWPEGVTLFKVLSYSFD